MLCGGVRLSQSSVAIVIKTRPLPDLYILQASCVNCVTSDMMYSGGDTETPREDSPIIFVITDTLKRVHPYPHEAHGLKEDWAASKQGWFKGRVVLTLSVIMQGL